MAKVPFNRPYATGREFDYIREAIACAHLASGGQFSRRCEAWLEQRVGCRRALLTHSCTAALEMAALLMGIQPGDEIVMPSYTFVSTANAFVLRGGVPVFVDIRPDTLNLDERLIEAALTPRTRAIVPVHYAGVACEMDAIMATARAHGLHVIEDAAQGLGSSYRGTPLGSFGEFAATSFHETKNVISGEGGALLINDESAVGPGEIVREKGTDRSRFFRGEVDKYTWVDVGSSFAPSELTAAFLWAQLEEADAIRQTRLRIWGWYNDAFAPLEQRGRLKRPFIPMDCEQNGHMSYILVNDAEARTRVLQELNDGGINAVFHYAPLHSAAAGVRFGRVSGVLHHTDRVAERLIRLPIWIGMSEADVQRAVSIVERWRGASQAGWLRLPRRLRSPSSRSPQAAPSGGCLVYRVTCLTPPRSSSSQDLPASALCIWPPPPG
jgi:dTDP-4-amino-4,6-dideoxygalactose transaminase